jgi:hypothetical protein
MYDKKNNNNLTGHTAHADNKKQKNTNRIPPCDETVGVQLFE